MKKTIILIMILIFFTNSLGFSLMTKYNLNLREGPNTENRVIAVMKKNTRVKVLEDNGEWSKVKYNNLVGYCATRFLVKPVSYVITNYNLNFRQKNTFYSNLLSVIPRHTRLAQLDRVGGWSKVKYLNKIGWVASNYVSDIYLEKAVKYNLSFRASQSSKSALIDTMPKGSVVEVIENLGEWSYILYNGKKGYCATRFLVKPVSYVKTDYALNFRKKNTSKSKLITVIPKHTRLAQLDRLGDWSKVKYLNKIGWVANNYLSDIYLKKATKYNLSFRASRSSKSALIDTMPKGSIVEVIENLGEWSYILYNGKKGYCATRFLKDDLKLIAITYDDGPGAYTEYLLNELKKLNAKATFFVLGSRVPYYRSTIKRMSDENHEIANHSYTHNNMPHYSFNAVRNDFNKAERLIYNITKKHTKLVRFPYGSSSYSNLRAVNKPSIFWSLDTLDWRYRDANYVYRTIIDRAKQDDIVLLHDVHKTSVIGSIRALKVLQNRGYSFVTVSDLFKLNNKALKPLNVYINGR